MIACVCRDIRDTDYATTEALKQRIMQDDAECCKCQRYYLKREEQVTVEQPSQGVSRQASMVRIVDPTTEQGGTATLHQFRRDMRHNGVKYTLAAPKHGGTYAALYIWNELIQDFVFECSLRGKDTAEARIDNLLKMGLIRT